MARCVLLCLLPRGQSAQVDNFRCNRLRDILKGSQACLRTRATFPGSLSPEFGIRLPGATDPPAKRGEIYFEHVVGGRVVRIFHVLIPCGVGSGIGIFFEI